MCLVIAEQYRLVEYGEQGCQEHFWAGANYKIGGLKLVTSIACKSSSYVLYIVTLYTLHRDNIIYIHMK